MALRLFGIAPTLIRNKPVRISIRCFSKFDVFGNSPIPANKQRFVPTSGTYPKGFLIGSINVGIKPASKSQPDLILVASEKPSCGAAVFTKNEFPAASITVTRDLVQKTKGHGLRAIIANSWCANTLTGKAGLEDAVAMSKEADKFVSGEPDAERDSSVMVMHTGVGGQR
jgi:glutamate N-acetyltransferase / amino-acid N-acetyltransferase